MRFFATVTGAFHSADTYRQTRADQGFKLGYTLLVVMLCTAVVMLYYGSIIHRELFMSRGSNPAVFDDVVQQIAHQLPVMTLKDNTLISNAPAPTVVKINTTLFGLAFTDQPIITVDTSGAATSANMKTPVLITQTELLVKTDKETKIKPLSTFTTRAPATILLNRAVIQEAATDFAAAVHKNLPMFYIIFGSISLVCFSIVLFVLRMFMLLALGLVGKLIAAAIKTPLDYATAVRLAAVSYTPVALLDTALFLGCQYTPHLLTLLAAGAVALYAAIRASTPPTPQQTA